MRWDYDPPDLAGAVRVILLGILLILVAGYYLGGVR